MLQTELVDTGRGIQAYGALDIEVFLLVLDDEDVIVERPATAGLLSPL